LLFAVLENHFNNVMAKVEAACESACHKPLAEMIREMVEAFVDAKMQRADISVALYRVSADVGGPELLKRVSQRSRKAVEAMLETAQDINAPPDKSAINIMLAAMAGAMRSLLEAGPSPATVRKSREQLVLLCQSYMAAATAKRV
jgi:Tetracyclin repressor-like, C-terminal domain